MSDSAASSPANPGEAPVAISPTGRRTAETVRWRRVAFAHLVVTLAGAGILIWIAQPVSGPVWESLPQAGFWQLLVASAVVLGGVGGVLEGLALRSGLSALAVVVLVGVAVPGLWLPVLALGRWFSDQQDYLIQTGALTAGLLGWLLLMVVIAGTAVAVATLGRRRGQHDE